MRGYHAQVDGPKSIYIYKERERLLSGLGLKKSQHVVLGVKSGGHRGGLVELSMRGDFDQNTLHAWRKF